MFCPIYRFEKVELAHTLRHANRHPPTHIYMRIIHNVPSIAAPFCFCMWDPRTCTHTLTLSLWPLLGYIKILFCYDKIIRVSQVPRFRIGLDFECDPWCQGDSLYCVLYDSSESYPSRPALIGLSQDQVYSNSTRSIFQTMSKPAPREGYRLVYTWYWIFLFKNIMRNKIIYMHLNVWKRIRGHNCSLI